MANILTRNIADDQHEQLKRLAARSGISVNEIILKIISEYLKENDPQICLGYFEVARHADIEAGDDCPECHQELGWPYYVAIFADGDMYGPVCSVCATN